MSTVWFYLKSTIIRKLIFLFALLYLFQLIGACLLIYFFYITQTQSSLDTLTQRVESDIKYKNGAWDTTEYDADPSVPGRFRLYVISTDGFVVDRWRPIAGFLDNSDFKHLIIYTSPQTVHTITNQNWRVYSKPLKDKFSNTIGLINVAFYNTYLKDAETLQIIDAKLENTAQTIEKKIVIHGQAINVDNLDIRSIPFDIPFQIVDQYNTVLMKDSNTNTMGRIPSFIDPSYLNDMLQNDSVRKIPNKKHTDVFLIKSHPLLDSNNNPYGIVVVATTIGIMYDLINIYAVSSIIVGVLLMFLFGFFVIRFLDVSGK